MSTGSRAKRRTRAIRKKAGFENFWNLGIFSNHVEWAKHWKKLATATLNKDFRVMHTKEQRYDDLWVAHKALMDKNCPGCKKTKSYRDKIKAVEDELKASKAEVERLEGVVKEFAIIEHEEETQ
jgi:hypothetical protein